MKARPSPPALAGGLFGLLCLFGAGAGTPERAAPAGTSPSSAGCPPGELRLDAAPGPPGAPCGAGRLFSTPEERARLDALRRRPEGRPPPPAPPPAPSLLPARAGPGAGRPGLRLDGVVLRSLGRDAAWVNGERVFGGGRTREGVRILGAEGRSLRLALPDGAGTIRLRAGQRLDPVTGVVREAWQAGGGLPGDPAALLPGAPAGAPEEGG